MTDAQRYFRGAREMIRRARNTDNLFEARRCRYLAEWFLEYRQKLLSKERAVLAPNSNHEGHSDGEHQHRV